MNSHGENSVRQKAVCLSIVSEEINGNAEAAAAAAIDNGEIVEQRTDLLERSAKLDMESEGVFTPEDNVNDEESVRAQKKGKF